MRRLAAVVFSVALAAAVISPLFRSPPRDSYPLSNYPMFSARLDEVNDVPTVVGRTEAGERKLLSPLAISGSDEVMQALTDVRNAVARGAAAAAALCAEVAERVRGDDLATLEVVTETYNTVDYFRGAKTPLEVQLHAECEVSR